QAHWGFPFSAASLLSRRTPHAFRSAACNRNTVRGLAIAPASNVRHRRSAAWQYCPRWLSCTWFAIAVAALLFIGACRRGVPVVDTAPKPLVANGTITGMVRGPEGTSPMSGRTVEAVNLATGERASVVTGTTGGCTG